MADCPLFLGTNGTRINLTKEMHKKFSQALASYTALNILTPAPPPDSYKYGHFYAHFIKQGVQFNSHVHTHLYLYIYGYHCIHPLTFSYISSLGNMREWEREGGGGTGGVWVRETHTHTPVQMFHCCGVPQGALHGSSILHQLVQDSHHTQIPSTQKPGIQV